MTLHYWDTMPGEWVDEALCAQIDPEIFFPDASHRNGPAAQICRRCPVQSDCLEFALKNNEQFGVWGGLGPHERRIIRRSGRLIEAEEDWHGTMAGVKRHWRSNTRLCQPCREAYNSSRRDMYQRRQSRGEAS